MLYIHTFLQAVDPSNGTAAIDQLATTLTLWADHGTADANKIGIAVGRLGLVAGVAIYIWGSFYRKHEGHGVIILRRAAIGLCVLMFLVPTLLTQIH